MGDSTGMRQIRFSLLRLISLLISLFMLSSCALLPREEELPHAPLIATYEAKPYKLAYVERGDMELSQELTLYYIPVKTETLGFAIGGEEIDQFFVKIGDAVKAGDLLVQLECDALLAQLSESKSLLAAYQLDLTQGEERRSLALARRRAEVQDMPADEQAAAMQEAGASYDKQKRDTTDNIYIQQQKIAALTREIGKRQLRAGMDGTVTFVKKTDIREKSTVGDALITLSDLTLSAFSSETSLWPYMHDGDEVIVQVNAEAYGAVVADEQTLGLAPQTKTEGKPAVIYLTLKQPLVTFEEDTRGTLTIIMDRREDVLMLPVDAITAANGEKIVYYQDASGARSIKKVQTGLKVGDMIEITDGLVEGETVLFP